MTPSARPLNLDSAFPFATTFGTGWQNGNPFVMRNSIGRAQDLTAGRILWPKTMQIVRGLHERGVRIATGSDLGLPWITPGVSIHREMELLVEAGISPREVLLIATRNGSQALGLDSQLGSIEVGKVADLVILRKNPLEDIRNTKTIEAVYRSSRRHEPADLLAAQP